MRPLSDHPLIIFLVILMAGALVTFFLAQLDYRLGLAGGIGLTLVAASAAGFIKFRVRDRETEAWVEPLRPNTEPPPPPGHRGAEESETSERSHP